MRNRRRWRYTGKGASRWTWNRRRAFYARNRRSRYRSVISSRARQGITATRSGQLAGTNRQKVSTLKRGMPIDTVPLGLPWSMTVKLRFIYTSTLTTQTSGIINSYAFRASSPYDPIVELGGNQPPYYDQLAQCYTSYRVKGSKCTARFSPDIAGQQEFYQMGVMLTTDDYSELSGFGPDKIMSLDTNKWIIGGSSGQTLEVSNYYSPRKFFAGIDPKDDALTSAVNDNPATEAFFHVWFSPRNTGSEQSIIYTATVEWIVEFYNPKVVSDS